MLEPQHGKQWIEAGSPDAVKLLVPIGDGKLHIYPVSIQINNPRASGKLKPTDKP